jgi:hypothetical protein
MVEPIPRVGVGVFLIRKDGAFVAGARKGSHGAGIFDLISSFQIAPKAVSDYKRNLGTSWWSSRVW